MKQHGFSNSLIISHICPFWLICSYKGQLQNPKCVVVHIKHLNKPIIILLKGNTLVEKINLGFGLLGWLVWETHDGYPQIKTRIHVVYESINMKT